MGLILIDSDPNTVKMWIAAHEGEASPDKDTEKGDNERAPPQKVNSTSSTNSALMFSEQSSMLGPQLKPQMLIGGNAPMFSMETTRSEADRRIRPFRADRRMHSSPASTRNFGIEMSEPDKTNQLPTLN